MGEKIQPVPIAIVAMNALYPGSVDKYGFWRNILEGKDLITDIPDSHFLLDDYYDQDPGEEDKIYCRRGGFLPEVSFDPLEFGVTPHSIPATDTSQLLALMVAKQVLEEAAGSQFASMDRDRISVILGVASTTDLVVDLSARIQRPVWEKALREGGLPEDQVQKLCDQIADHYVPWQEASFPGLLGNVVAGRIANRLNLGGTNTVTDAACASSLSAIAVSIMELVTYQSDLVISGGVDTLNNIFMHMCFTKTPALSRTSDCRPFSDQADGTLLGEGIGMVALKRLADAERDNDRIYAVIRGYGTSSDGLAKSIYAPRSEGQAKALRRAYAMAGYGPETVELVEAHGTGTKAGDVAEFEGLRTVFSESGRTDLNWCALGSVKSQIGHTKAAAGAAGLFKVAMALHHKVLPPTIKVERPNPALEIETSPFYLNTEARPWIRNSSHPRRAALSSFGFGGSNFHLTLEEYAGPGNKAYRQRTAPGELVVFCAEDAASLLTAISKTEEQLGSEGTASLQALARESQAAYTGRQRARLAVAAREPAELLEKLQAAKARIEAGRPKVDGDGWFLQMDGEEGSRQAATPPKIAFLFPGQGSQYVGMTKELTMAYDAARKVWDESADGPPDQPGLHQVVFPTPVFNDEAKKFQARRLTATEWAQPAIGAASLAMLALTEKIGLQPHCVAGHSFGEVTALRAAGVLDNKTTLAVARRRGELMKAVSESPGVMTAVFHASEEVEQQLVAAGASLTIANDNSPQQCVLSGPSTEMESFEQHLQAEGMHFRRLPVANAFHSDFVTPAVQPFQTYLEAQEFRRAKLPVYSNFEGGLFPEEPDAIKQRLARQIARPVSFRQQIEAMAAQGVNIFIEVGPGAVLTGLVRQCLGDGDVRAVSLDQKGSPGLMAWWQGLAQLVAAGVPMNLTALWETVEPWPVVTEVEDKKMSVQINGANYGRPYPPQDGGASLPKADPEPVPIQADPAASTPVPISRPSPLELPPRSVPAAVNSNPQRLQEGFSGGSTVNFNAYIQLQRQVVDAHSEYLRLISASHLQFMRSAAGALNGNGAYVVDVNDAPVVEGLVHNAVKNPPASALPLEVPVSEAAPPLQVSMPAAVPVDPPAAVAANRPAATPMAPRTGEVNGATRPSAPAEASAKSIEETILEIVSEKTGYPVDVLDKEADLEAGLGIDSIKRVEIFAALQQRMPELPSIEPGQLASLRTLNEIGDFVGNLMGDKKKQ